MTAPYPTEFERRLKRAYSCQRRSAFKRGIPFLFTFEQWSKWWLTDDRWSRRDRKAGQFQMGRKGNSGPYSPDNVECATKEEKQQAQLTALSSLSPEKRAEIFKKIRPCPTRRKTLAGKTSRDAFRDLRHCHGSRKSSRHNTTSRFGLCQRRTQRLALPGRYPHKPGASAARSHGRTSTSVVYRRL